MPEQFSINVPISKSSLSSIVAERIIHTVKTGGLKPGDRLPSISEIAKKLDVGQSSVREALKRLELLGIVNVEHGKGIFVKEADIGSLLKDVSGLLVLKEHDILCLMEARKIVEYSIVRLVVERISEEEIKELDQLVRRMQSEVDDPENFIKDDMDFHLRLAELSKNPILPIFLGSIRSLFIEEQKAVVRLPDAAKRASKYHAEICQAITERDSEKAGKAMMQHLVNIEKAISQYVRDLAGKEKVS